MSLTIVEVLGRSSQGRTEPYVCRGDDGEVYFVKGRSATRPGLIAEWLCARLAEHFGLPLPPYSIATVPEELIEADLTGWLHDLGVGEVFASQRINAVELTEVHRELVPAAVRRDVIAFDWWVRNGDRNLTVAGGNPNLLWNPEGEGSLVVIDHNLAFDPDFWRTTSSRSMCLRTIFLPCSAIFSRETPTLSGFARPSGFGTRPVIMFRSRGALSIRSEPFRSSSL